MRVEPFSIQEKWRERWHFQCKCDLKTDIQFEIRMIFVSSSLLTNSLIVLGNTQIPFVRNWVRLSVYHGEVQCSKSFRQSPGKCYHKCTPWQSDYITVFAIRLLVIIMYYSLKESNLGKKFLASSTMHDLCTVFNMDKRYEERKVVVISVFW